MLFLGHSELYHTGTYRAALLGCNNKIEPTMFATEGLWLDNLPRLLTSIVIPCSLENMASVARMAVRTDRAVESSKL